MTNDPTAGTVPVAEPAVLPPRRRNDPSGGFAGIAALGAVFAGVLFHGRTHDPLATVFAAGLTFLGALIALHVLHLAFRIANALGKIAIPAVGIVLLGCACDWPWAETAMDWMLAVGSRGVEVAERGWAAWHAG